MSELRFVPCDCGADDCTGKITICEWCDENIATGSRYCLVANSKGVGFRDVFTCDECDSEDEPVERQTVEQEES